MGKTIPQNSETWEHALCFISLPNNIRYDEVSIKKGDLRDVSICILLLLCQLWKLCLLLHPTYTDTNRHLAYWNSSVQSHDWMEIHLVYYCLNIFSNVVFKIKNWFIIFGAIEQNIRWTTLHHISCHYISNICSFNLVVC
jgi:hypothetical protein